MQISRERKALLLLDRAASQALEILLDRAASQALEILVVDDDEDVRQTISAILETERYRVLQAASGDEALAVMRGRQGRIDLLLTDVRMPGMSGPELVRRLRRQWPDLRALLITGFASGEACRESPGQEPTPLLKKPFHLNELTSRIRELLEPRSHELAT
jgi:two-component system, cell cycle sensor histidine kinase and response regulator CckA